MEATASFTFFNITSTQPRKWLFWLNTIIEKAQKVRTPKAEILQEISLIEKAKIDPQYFAPLYEKYYSRVFIYVNKRIGDEHHTAEVTSHVFYKCLSKLSSFQYQGVPFGAWLFKIAINEVNQFFRKKKKVDRLVSLDDSHIELLNIEVENSNPEIDKSALIPALLETLTTDEVQYLELRFFEQRSFKEMAYFLGLTEVNAKIKTYRILEKLRKSSRQVKFYEE